MGIPTPEMQMLRKGKVKEMLRNRRVYIMLRMGKGNIMKMLIEISYLWDYLREKFPFSAPIQWH